MKKVVQTISAIQLNKWGQICQTFLLTFSDKQADWAQLQKIANTEAKKYAKNKKSKKTTIIIELYKYKFI